MRIISKLRIEGFRSIKNLEIDGFGNFTVFAGLNNAGKSNVLRALNAFFHGETDPGRYIDVDRDYYRPDLRKKKAKRIRVAVTFDLPPSFRFPQAIRSAGEFLGRRFEITKEWQRRDVLPSYRLNNGEPLDLEQRQKVDQFLQLITFRYVPNRVLPVEVIRSEHAALRDVLVRRLGRRTGAGKDTFDAIRDTSEALIRSMKRRVSDEALALTDIRLAAPRSWAEVLFAFGYRVVTGDVEVEDDLQGAGVQGWLMLETLYLIDRDYFQKFGWRQAAIWAVEEPEASLHASLEVRVGGRLAEIAGDQSSRLQVLCTSHSSAIVQHAERVFFVNRGNGGTRAELVGPEEALDRLARAGVSPWVHPLLYFPLEPLVLVEGKYDFVFLDRAFQLLKPKRKVKVSYLERLAGKSGGVEGLKKYVKDHLTTIRMRRRDAPVVVVLDWDAARKKSDLESLGGDDVPLRVLAWPEAQANPKLSKSFRGVERFYSDRLIKMAIERGAPIAQRRDGTWVVAQEEVDQVKRILCELVEEDLGEEDLSFARSFLEEVLRMCGAL